MARKLATVICGNAGVGKSALGALLAKHRGAVLIDIDTCSERLARLVLRAEGLHEDDRDSRQYKQLLRAPIYETLFDIAVENLKHVPCVIVGPFTLERRTAHWPQELAARLGTSVEVVVLHCDSAERRRRIEARGNPRDTAKLLGWEDYSRHGADPAPPPFPHRWVDTTHQPLGTLPAELA